jgi:hypothetical protein
MAKQQDAFFDVYRNGLAQMLAMTRATLDESEQPRNRQLEAIQLTSFEPSFHKLFPPNHR